MAQCIWVFISIFHDVMTGGLFFSHFLEAFIYLTLLFHYICMCINRKISLFSHMSAGDKPQSLDEKPHQHQKPHALRGLERGGLCSLLWQPAQITSHIINARAILLSFLLKIKIKKEEIPKQYIVEEWRNLTANYSSGLGKKEMLLHISRILCTLMNVFTSECKWLMYLYQRFN